MLSIWLSLTFHTAVYSFFLPKTYQVFKDDKLGPQSGVEYLFLYYVQMWFTVMS